MTLPTVRFCAVIKNMLRVRTLRWFLTLGVLANSFQMSYVKLVEVVILKCWEQKQVLVQYRIFGIDMQSSISSWISTNILVWSLTCNTLGTYLTYPEQCDQSSTSFWSFTQSLSAELFTNSNLTNFCTTITIRNSVLTYKKYYPHILQHLITFTNQNKNHPNPKLHWKPWCDTKTGCNIEYFPDNIWQWRFRHWTLEE